MRKICVVTTTRAEYGLLKPLMEKIDNDELLDLQLIVTGTHLEKAYGNTYKEIEKDFEIDAKIPMNLASDAKESLSIAMADLQKDITKVLLQLQPDILVILGDRYEILSVATAATMLQIPLAHIHGGELTQGVIDDAIRHAVTKLSHLHFTATQEYTNRVIQLGEEPKRVFNVGSLGVENIKNLKLLSKEEFETSVNFKLGKKNLLVTYHPQTISQYTPQEQFRELLKALDTFNDTKVIFTKSNADAGAKEINKMIDDYVHKNKDRSIAFASLGQLRYFSAIKYVNAVVGNSSSGILEVPSFCKPTINIGARQEGRVQAKSVINCEILQEEIQKAIYKAYDKEFIQSLQNITNPYESKETSLNIKETLKHISLDTILHKKFYDLRGET